jgi:hypothetical protein
MIAAAEESNKRVDAHADASIETHDARYRDRLPRLSAYRVRRRRAGAAKLARKFPLPSVERKIREGRWETLGHDDASAD